MEKTVRVTSSSENHLNSNNVSDGVEMILSQSIEDLSKRWFRSRLSALKSFKIDSEESFFKEINELPETQYEDLLKIIFLNSRNLGLGYQKQYNLAWERTDFSRHLQRLGSPCLNGDWENRISANVLTRLGCDQGRQIGSRYCQYWREAIDGLVAGLGDDTGYMRHSSVVVGDQNCTDVFYQDEVVPTDALWSNEMRWGPLSIEMKEKLATIEKKFERMKVSLSFLGLSEKNLFYKLEAKENLTCGTSGAIYRGLLEKWVENNFPSFRLKDASPVAVYGEKT